jgi:hypothetical protein
VIFALKLKLFASLKQSYLYHEFCELTLTQLKLNGIMLSGAKGQTVKLLTPSECRAPQTQRHSCLSGDYQSQLICDLEQIFDYSDALLISFHILKCLSRIGLLYMTVTNL